MSILYVARNAMRRGLYLPTKGTAKDPSLLFLLPKTSANQLDDQIRSQLEKQGITDEAEVNAIVARAEAKYEENIKIRETRKEVNRLMKIRAGGGKLMQVGYRKWKQAFYPGGK